MKRTPQFFMGASVLASLLINFSCTPDVNLSPMQIRQITTKLFNCGYENAYRATLTVVQDQGYLIKNTDVESGLIVASVDRRTSSGSQFLQHLLTRRAYNKGTEIELSCVVNKLNAYSTEIRINIQEIRYGESSRFSGTTKQDARQIYEPNIYQTLFNEIEIEIKRREAFEGGKSSLGKIQIDEQVENTDKTMFESAKAFKVIAARAPVFKTPQKNVVLNIPQGAVLKVLGISGNFYYIELLNPESNEFIKGYIHKEFVQEISK